MKTPIVRLLRFALFAWRWLLVRWLRWRTSGYGYRFSECWALPCDPAYMAILRGLTLRTNAAPFRGFAAGAILFEGADGQATDQGRFIVTFKFAVSLTVQAPGKAIYYSGDFSTLQIGE